MMRTALSGAILLLALAACGQHPSAPSHHSTPALWLAEDADSQIYLLGTVHQLPDNMDWASGKVGAVISDAEHLIVEIAPDDADTAPQILAKLANDGAPPPLLQRVPPKLRPTLAQLIRDTGVPPDQLDHMDTWAATMMLSNALNRASGMSASHGVEATLEDRFGNRSIKALETAEAQLSLFDAMQETTQRALLAKLVAEAPDSKSKIAELVRLWSAGDADGLAAYLDHEMADTPEIKALLMTNRNHAWAKRIGSDLNLPGKSLVAVGAGHLVGAESLPDQLKLQGFRVARIQ